MNIKLPKRDPREWGLFRFFITQNVFFNLIYAGIIILGLILWFFIMNREAFGNFDFDLVQVQTPYSGATAEEVEQLVTLPLENGVKTLEGIEEMWSISVEGLSVITIQLDPDDDTQKTVRTIEREVDEIRTTDLPEDGDEPQVTEITAAFPVLTIGVSGDVPEKELRDVADDLEDDLLDIEGVSRVNKKGYKEKEIWVETDPSTLARHHLSLLDLVNSVRRGDHTSPGGRLELKGQEIIVRTIGKLETVDDVERVVVRSNEEGNLLQVKDVATVSERLERERKFTRLDGTRSIEIDVLKKDSGDTLKIDAEIKEIVQRYRETRNPKIGYGFANEISFYINRRLDVLIKNGTVGIMLVLIIMFLFLTPQSAFWSTTAIPFAFLGGLVTMHAFGMTINLLSLFAFILVSGMLVDNGIVVAEYIERKREENVHPFTAVSVGISEMSMPIFAAALTTIIAFAPLAFMSGITGKFLSQMPLVLIACLVADLIECMFILPGHLHHYNWNIGRLIPSGIMRVREKAQSGLTYLTTRYVTFLQKVARHPGKTALIIIPSFFLLFALSILFMVHRFQLFPNIIDVFAIKYELPVGVTLDQSEKVAAGFERIVAKIPREEIDAVITQVGSQGERERSNSGTNVGEVRVFLNKANPDRTDGPILIESIREEVEAYAKEAQVSKFELEKIRGGPPTGRAIEVQVSGDDYGILNDISQKTQDLLRSIDGTVGVTDDFDEGKDEFRLVIDRDAVARAGLEIASVATVVRAAFDGQEAVEIKRVGETTDISVKVKLKESFRKKKQTMDQLTITNPRGKLIPLQSLVKLEKGRGILSILRNDGERTITIKGDVREDVTSSNEVGKQIDAFLKENLKDYPGVSYKFGGERKNQQESMASLYKAIAVALGLIFLVLATLFRSYWEPLIIISVVPLAFIGICISLAATGKPITLLVLIGFTGLTGVVVNNSILMLETFNRLKEQKDLTFDDTVIQGAAERLRPILLTSFSTFFGVMPLGLGLGGKEPFLQDMAFSFGCGLLFCSLLTLIWIPFLTVSTKDLGDFVLKLCGRKNEADA